MTQASEVNMASVIDLNKPMIGMFRKADPS